MKKKITGIFRHALNDQLKWIKLLSLIFISFACTPQPQNVTDLSDPAPIYPDYTDITIPYKELALLEVIAQNGTRTEIIRDGRFVLPGTEELNRPFEEA